MLNKSTLLMQLSKAIPSLPAISCPAPTSQQFPLHSWWLPVPHRHLAELFSPVLALTGTVELCAAMGRGGCAQGTAPWLGNMLSILWEGLTAMPWAAHETRSPETQQKMPLKHQVLQQPDSFHAEAKAAFQYYRNNPSLYPLSPQFSLLQYI